MYNYIGAKAPSLFILHTEAPKLSKGNYREKRADLWAFIEKVSFAMRL